MGRGARARFAGWQVNKINLTSLGANLYTVAATLLLPSNVCGLWSAANGGNGNSAALDRPGAPAAKGTFAWFRESRIPSG